MQIITKNSLLDYFSANDEILFGAFSYVDEHPDHLTRELNLIGNQAEKELESPPPIKYQYKSKEHCICFIPNFFGHRLGQRYYSLLILRIEDYKKYLDRL